MKRQYWIVRLDRVWSEYLAAEDATGLLAARIQADPSFGSGRGWWPRDALRLAAKLEMTFLIRISAEFEAGLRDAWRNALGRPTQPPMKDLMAAISARYEVPGTWHVAADDVRLTRNALLHEGRPGLALVPLAASRAHLARYLSRLPPDW